MPLRVLLADESSAIRKVIQLSLQDYAVEIKSVHRGDEVLSMMPSFRPDIVLADVLLQSRSGYDVAKDIKREYSSVPVVLMWSGFMEFDDQQFQGSGAEDKLEKPFDSHSLRKMIQRLVNKTQDHPLSEHLEFPEVEYSKIKSLEIAENAEEPSDKSRGGDKNIRDPGYQALNEASSSSTWNMDSFEEISDSVVDRAFPTHVGPLGQAPLVQAPLGEKVDNTLAEFHEGHEEKVNPEANNAPVTATSNKVSQTMKEKLQDAAELLDENFSEVRLRDTSRRHLGHPSHRAIRDEASESGPEISRSEEWEQRDLSRYKLDLPVDDDDEFIPIDSSQQAEVVDTRRIMQYSVVDSESSRVDFPAAPAGTGSGRTARAQLRRQSSPPVSVPAQIPLQAQVELASDEEFSSRDELSRFNMKSSDPRMQLNEKQLENLVNSKAREIIESVVWKVVPEIATKLIKEELQRLMIEAESSGEMKGDGL